MERGLSVAAGEQVSEERVAMICRIRSAFYVHLRLNVCTETVVSMLGVILGNRKSRSQNNSLFSPVTYSFLL